MQNVRRDQQATLFDAVLDSIAAMSTMINKVVEISVDGSMSMYDLPQLD